MIKFPNQKMKILTYMYNEIKNGRTIFTMHEIAKNLGIPKPTIAYVIKELSEKGVVKRKMLLINDGNDVKVAKVYEVNREEFEKFFKEYLNKLVVNYEKISRFLSSLNHVSKLGNDV